MFDHTETETAPEASIPLEGILRRVVFRNPDNAWTVLRLEIAGRADPVTAVGRLPALQAGDHVRLHGRWVIDRRYGRQFAVETCLSVPPATTEGLRRYLGSGRIPGVGEVLADRIVTAFGEQALEVIEAEPDRLREVEGIGRARAGEIAAILSREKSFHQVMVFLRGHDVSAALAGRIHARYGPATPEVVREDPYRLAHDITGIGFRTADRIARSLGFAMDDPRRLRAGVMHLLHRAAEEGHLFLPERVLLRRAAAGLEADPEAIGDAVADLAGTDHLQIEAIGDDLGESDHPGDPASPEHRAIYLPDLRRAEVETAARLAEIGAAKSSAEPAGGDRAFEELEDRERIGYTEEQREAIRSACREPLMVITGGPGTGKTTLVRGLLWILEGRGDRIALCAPTGRAARRIRETTGRDARTIHRLLEFHPARRVFQRHRSNPIDADVLIVDETSMVDMPLAHRLLDAVPDGCRVIFVGDADQLPPVGPGNLLRDLLASGAVPVRRLTEIHRQASESAIVRNAHRILAGRMPEWTGDEPERDFFFLERRTPAEIVDTLKRLIAERIPDRFGVDPIGGVQVLSPMHRGPIGVQKLNEVFQQLLNPDGRPVAAGPVPIRVGDKVMQLRNNYDREVFNGDTGRVESFDRAEGWVGIRFDDRLVTYGRDDLGEITLAYACTVHKSQGSEYPVVVAVLHTQHAILLQRNLLYTAITRGRRGVILVGTRRAVEMAVRIGKVHRRHTRLTERLRMAMENG